MHVTPYLVLPVPRLATDFTKQNLEAATRFQHHNEKHNLSLAESMLDKIVAAGQGQLETVLI